MMSTVIVTNSDTHGKHKITQLPMTWESMNQPSGTNYAAHGALRQSKLAAVKTGAFVYL